MIESTMTEEMLLACQPFIDGAINAEHTRLKSWRYFLEINSACTLHCPTCTKGNVEGYEHENGFMDWELMLKILDKIKSENPNAIVFTYGNSEPFVHPKLPECIAEIKARGLHPELSTNLNMVRRVDELLASKPDLIIISLSGFTQEVYVKGHAGGDIEKVKRNMITLAHANNALPVENRVNIQVNYHVYRDNEHEIPLMKEFCQNLGIGFFTSFARAISMENAIQYCRHHDTDATPYEIQEGRPDYNLMLPPVGNTYKTAMERIHISPLVAREMYKDLPEHRVCPIGWMFTFIRHDGKTSMCACVADRRLTVGDYLTTSQDERIQQRTGHPICQQCTKYKMRYYFHIVGRDKWISPN